MRHLAQIFSKILLFVFLGAVGAVGSFFVMNHTLKAHAGVSNVGALLETIRLRTSHPTMSPEKIAEQAAKADGSPMALLKTLASGKLAPASVAPNTGAAQPGARTNPSATIPANAAAVTAPTGREVQLRDAADGREVIGIIPARGPQDFNAIDRINALNIPDDLKQKILKNYEATGVLPEIVMREKRKPASTDENSQTE